MKQAEAIKKIEKEIKKIGKIPDIEGLKEEMADMDRIISASFLEGYAAALEFVLKLLK